MKRTFKVTGAVIIPIVATGLLVWFAIPHVRADDGGDGGKASVCGATAGCPEGVCCGDIIAQTGGCAEKDCCEESEQLCIGGYSRTSLPFPKVRIDGDGNCLVQGSTKEPYCIKYDCEGSLMCAVGDCGASSEGEELKRYPPVEGNACPVLEE